MISTTARETERRGSGHRGAVVTETVAGQNRGRELVQRPRRRHEHSATPMTDPHTSSTATDIAVGAETVGNVSDSGGVLRRVRGMRKWDGIVNNIDEGLLVVDLVPVDHEGPPLEADFPLELLTDEERASVVVGDVVYVTVRTVLSSYGVPEMTSALRLRRAKVWTAAEVEETERWAAEMGRSIGELAD